MLLRPSTDGPVLSVLRVAAAIAALGWPCAAGAQDRAQDRVPASTPSAATTPTDAVPPDRTPSAAPAPDATETDNAAGDDQGVERTPPRKSGDKLKLRWRSAALEYGRKARLDFRGRFRGEMRASDAAITKDVIDDLDIPRKRVGVDGQLMGAVAFKLDRELDNVNPWRDAYVDVIKLGEAQFRYGQFKIPFSMDETTGSLDLEFAYRSTTATLLAPSRAKGWMVHGDTFDRAIGYEYGVFETDGSNALVRTSLQRVNAGETKAWRITSEPLHGMAGPLADIHFGYAKTRGDVPEGESGIKGRTVLGADFYKEDFLVFGLRERKGYEFRWRPGPASIKMESITLTEERKGESVENTDLSPYQVKAWYVSGSYIITGENKILGANRPNKPLGQGGFGAFEVAVRVERLTFGSVATGVGSKSPRADILLSNTDKITAFGGNWFPNRWIKVQDSLFKEEFSDPSALRKEIRSTPSFWSKVLRIQFSI
jgi:phosphate-selective porin OprO and OprP